MIDTPYIKGYRHSSGQVSFRWFGKSTGVAYLKRTALEQLNEEAWRVFKAQFYLLRELDQDSDRETYPVMKRPISWVWLVHLSFRVRRAWARFQGTEDYAIILSIYELWRRRALRLLGLQYVEPQETRVQESQAETFEDESDT